jgi:hypothetical protein
MQKGQNVPYLGESQVTLPPISTILESLKEMKGFVNSDETFFINPYSTENILQ